MQSFYLGSPGGIQFKIYNKLEELKTLDFNEGIQKQKLIDKSIFTSIINLPNMILCGI